MPFSKMWHIYKKKIFHRLLFGLLTNSEQGFGVSKQRDIIPDNVPSSIFMMNRGGGGGGGGLAYT